MDTLKSYCYVIFATTEDATATLRATDDLQWPPRAVQSIMKPKFVTLMEAEAVLESNGTVRLQQPGPSRSAEPTAPAAVESPAGTSAKEEEDVDVVAPAERMETSAASIFRITSTAPPLYWLPVAEEDVRARTEMESAKMEAARKAKMERDAERQKRADEKAAASAALQQEEASADGDGKNIAEVAGEAAAAEATVAEDAPADKDHASAAPAQDGSDAEV